MTYICHNSIKVSVSAQTKSFSDYEILVKCSHNFNLNKPIQNFSHDKIRRTRKITFVSINVSKYIFMFTCRVTLTCGVLWYDI